MDELDTLLAYDFPAEHAVHLRTTNPIESIGFDRKAPDQGHTWSPLAKAALVMAYKLLGAAQALWYKIAAPGLVPLVRAGAPFIDGNAHEKRLAEDLKTGPAAAQPPRAVHNI